LISMQYNASQKTYEPWEARNNIVSFDFNDEVETATIDIDDTGRMWIAYERNGQVMVRWANPNYGTWSDEIPLANVREDDIATVAALPGKIGVFWSNQITQRFGFRTHLNEDPTDVWSADEVPASQSALQVGDGMADDHMNLAVSSTGVLYAAVKHGYNMANYPLISLLVRNPDGTWHDSYEVSQIGTTPIALLNETLGKIKVAYSSATYNGAIVYRESPTSNIGFGPVQTLIPGTTLRDPTGIKATYHPDVVVLANNQPAGQAVGVLA